MSQYELRQSINQWHNDTLRFYHKLHRTVCTCVHTGYGTVNINQAQRLGWKVRFLRFIFTLMFWCRISSFDLVPVPIWYEGGWCQESQMTMRCIHAQTQTWCSPDNLIPTNSHIWIIRTIIRTIACFPIDSVDIDVQIICTFCLIRTKFSCTFCAHYLGSTVHVHTDTDRQTHAQTQLSHTK